ncbi:subtilase family protein [Krasilnikovia cinnamomea]|uniref:Subtilase family protein n=1 Tax=Krasilnikovia cinnamomea TaxID=349313 RepID=A0A4Q7ZLE2_9ACTN|nr:S8 family serine peptidase [Krasilnikovia cinnamomea]RZU51411.1 subtilase family protein [Krasilnikovia cinnamomea]
MAEHGQAPGTGQPKGRPDKAADRRAEAASAAPPPGGRSGTGGDPSRRTEPSRPRDHATGSRGPTAAEGGEHPETLRPRPERYLVAPTGWASLTTVGRAGPTDPAADAQHLIEALQRNPDLKVLRVIRSTEQPPTGGTPPIYRPGSRFPAVAVVEATPEQAAILAARPEFHVDIDHPLTQDEPLPPWTRIPGTGTLDDAVPIRFQVRDDRGEALPDAMVYVHGGRYPVVARTGADGTAELTVPVGSLDAVRGVYVRPHADCWSTVVDRPHLSGTEVNTVACRRLDTTASERHGDGWARRAMGFDRLPPTYRGHGVRIAVIGSGVDAGRLDAAEGIMGGIDVVGQDEKSWDQDSIGRATHHVALILGHDGDQLVGLAPEAEVHVCRVLPGGRLSDLIEALDYCIAQEVDVIDLGTYTGGAAGLVAHKLEEARQAGILCVAAAGDTGGPVMFPGTAPAALTVGAIGQLGTCPPESPHISQLSGMPTPEGFVAARFSSAGPEVDLCAPGVGIVSAVAPEGRAALDGTGIAATHVAALAALVLAHHPDFRYGFGMRGPARVQRLAQLLKASCRPLRGIDPYRCGAGMPDAAVAVGLVPYWTTVGVPEATAPMPGGPTGVRYDQPNPAAARHGYPQMPPDVVTLAAVRAAGFLVPEPDE